jgi:hypothetical protein
MGVTGNPQTFADGMGTILVYIHNAHETRIQKLRVDPRVMLPKMPHSNNPYPFELDFHTRHLSPRTQNMNSSLLIFIPVKSFFVAKLGRNLRILQYSALHAVQQYK